MPNRILRAELLDSEPWLSLKDNADRAAWIACFLSADTLGDMPAGPLRLTRLWTPYGIDTSERAGKVLLELCDVDLLRRYEVGGKPYVHIPRYRQTFRYLGHLWPISPWATTEEKQRVAQKSHAIHLLSPVIHGDPRTDVDVDVDVDVDKSSSKTLVAAVAAPQAQAVKKKVKSEASRATRLPKNWELPDDWLAWAVALRTDWNEERVLRESLVFRDHWLAAPGQKGTKNDWQATWRNWVRRGT